jgi:hypothetical protein
MRGKGQCGSKATCDDDAYLAKMKKTNEALKNDQDARMKKEMKGVADEIKRSKKLGEMITNPMHKDTTLEELNNLGGRKTRKGKKRRNRRTRRH